jgi:drug/metabolite transporter (DMT)-like permease
MDKDKPHTTAIPFRPASTAASKAPSWTPALFGAVALAGCGHLLIKFGLNRIRASEAVGVAGWLNPWLFFGLGIYGVGTLLWIFAVSRTQISYLYPITALNYAIVALGGRLLFQESVSPTRWLSIAIVIAGVMLMQWSAKPSSTPLQEREAQPPSAVVQVN